MVLNLLALPYLTAPLAKFLLDVFLQIQKAKGRQGTGGTGRLLAYYRTRPPPLGVLVGARGE